MTLDEARALVAQEQSPLLRDAAEQMLDEAAALPHLPPEQRDAAVGRIRKLETRVRDYQLRSFGASVLEAIADTLAEPAQKTLTYAEALHLAQWYASGATSGGEGTARSRHVHELEAKLHALDPASYAAPAAASHADDAGARSAAAAAREALVAKTPRPAFLTRLGWIFIVAGGLGVPVSAISLLMIMAGGQGSSSGGFFDALIVLGGPPATLLAGIGLLRRQRWAHGYAVAVLSLFALSSIVQMLKGSTPEVSTVSPSGLITTQLAWSVNYPFHLAVVAISVALLVKLLSPAMRAQFAWRSPGT
jgi:hypothetical protein